MLSKTFSKVKFNSLRCRPLIIQRLLQQSSDLQPSSRNPPPPPIVQEENSKIPTETLSNHYRAVKAIGLEKPQTLLQVFNTDRSIAATTITFFNSVDLRPHAVRKWVLRKLDAARISSQRVIPQRLLILGPDLAAAHFLVFRGASVRFKGQEKWIKLGKNRETPETDLPSVFTDGFDLEAIDASNVQLVYEGFEVLRNLRSLKWLSLSNCQYINDWCLDRLAGEYRNTLEYLDVSNCEFITEKGIAALSKLQNLKHLRLGGHKYAQDLELTCLYLEEQFPGILIEGVDYFNPSRLPLEEIQMITAPAQPV